MDENYHDITMQPVNDFNNEEEIKELFLKFKKLYQSLGKSFLEKLERLPSLPDMIVDRWEKGKLLGFGEGTNIYDNSLVIGNVQIGKECWIGPNTILDGSGDLFIGDYCTVSAGVHVYTHDNVRQTLSSKKLPIERMPTRIGNNVYIGPNSVITKGVTIGSNVVIGSFALVNKDIPESTIVIGQPAKQVGIVQHSNTGEITYKYFEK
jgi:acetyltransferase-like isoleucine patch superfamily enzyme